MSFVRSGESERAVEPLRRLCDSIDTRSARPLPAERRSRRRPEPVRDDAIPGPARPDGWHVGEARAHHRRQVLRRPARRPVVDGSVRDERVGSWPACARSAQCRVHGSRAAWPSIRGIRWCRALLRGEAAKLQTFERDACQHFDRVVWVTEEDRRAVGAVDERSQSPRLRDSDRDRSHHAAAARAERSRSGSRFSAACTGRRTPRACRGSSRTSGRAWRQPFPSAVLTLIGKAGIASSLRECAARRGEGIRRRSAAHAV